MSPPEPLHRPAAPLRLPSFWLLQVTGWSCVALLTIPLREVAYGSLANAALMGLYNTPIGIVISTGLRAIYRPLLIRRWPFSGLAVLVLACSTGAAVLDIWAIAAGNRFFGIDARSDVVGPGHYFLRAALYLSWSLIYMLLKQGFAAREAAWKASLAEERARLETLRYQLNPHFLFNTLTTICGEIHRQPDAARDMAVRLAEFYGHTLRHVDCEVPATLGDEVALLRAYLEIEQLRLGRSLTVDFAVEEDALSLRFPPVLLLPLAENAVKYGCATSPERLDIAVTVSLAADGKLRIEVANTGRLLVGGERMPVSTRVGLANLRARLEHFYAGRHTFDLTARDGWVRAVLQLQTIELERTERALATSAALQTPERVAADAVR